MHLRQNAGARSPTLRRRALMARLAGAVVSWPLAGVAQQQAMPRIGTLGNMQAAEYGWGVAAFRQGLEDKGYLQSRNIAIDFLWADNHYERLSGLATELVSRRVAVLVAFGGTNATLALYQATKEIPIVTAIAADPIKLGLIASLARPGGNVTGVDLITTEMVPKRLQLLKELVPDAAVIGMLVNPQNPDAEEQLNDAKRAAASLGREIDAVSAATAPEIDAAFAGLAQRRVSALLLGNDSFFNTRREQLVGLAARYAIPALYPYALYTAVGGLVNYAPSLVIAYRQCGHYVAKILGGEKPADLPMQQPTKFELVVNLKTAKALGLTVPPSLLARADEVIE